MKNYSKVICTCALNCYSVVGLCVGYVLTTFWMNNCLDKKKKTMKKWAFKVLNGETNDFI